jgi:uncharacterized protein (TIGR03435 family)
MKPVCRAAHSLRSARSARSLDAARKLLLGLVATAAVAGPVVVGMATAPQLRGQSAIEAPWVFEVASVKPHPLPPNQLILRGSGPGLQVHGDRFTANGTTLSGLMMDAYNVKEYQISGLPRWAQGVDCDHFDIAAKSEKVPTANQLRQMLQALLADRFKVKLHREMKELPVYALVIGKNGSKLRKLREDEHVPTYASRPPRMATAMGELAGLVNLLSMFVDRPVVDQTGLTGAYEYANLDWAQFGRERGGIPADDASGLSIFGAVQQELGLKLEARKDPVEVLVIDHAEKPSEN